MSDEIVKWCFILDPSNDNSEWPKTAIIDEHGTIFVPCSLVDDVDEQSVYAKALHDGVPTRNLDGHLFVSNSWLKTAYPTPDTSEICHAIEIKMRPQHYTSKICKALEKEQQERAKIKVELIEVKRQIDKLNRDKSNQELTKMSDSIASLERSIELYLKLAANNVPNIDANLKRIYSS